MGRAPRPAGVAAGGPVARRSLAAGRGDLRVEPGRHPRARPVDRRVGDAGVGRRSADRTDLRRRRDGARRGHPHRGVTRPRRRASPSTTTPSPPDRRRGTRSCPSATTSSARSASAATACTWSPAAPPSTRSGPSTPTAPRRRRSPAFPPRWPSPGWRPTVAGRTPSCCSTPTPARPPPGGWRGMRRPSRGVMSPTTRRRSPAPFASRRPRTGRSTAPRSGLFLVHRADVTPSPATPAILDGYGGFAITKAPAFVAHAAAWCAAGGLFAVAGLRGGWEHGEAWHLAGNRGQQAERLRRLPRRRRPPRRRRSHQPRSTRRPRRLERRPARRRDAHPAARPVPCRVVLACRCST